MEYQLLERSVKSATAFRMFPSETFGEPCQVRFLIAAGFEKEQGVLAVEVQAAENGYGILNFT